VLQAVGRTPNGKKIAADKAGVAVTDRGFINVDIQMRTNVPHIFAIGDIVGQPMLAHKAVHEAHVAAEVIAGELQGNKELASAAFNARVIPSVAYTDPEVAWVGLTEDQAKAQGIKVKKGLFPWAASGRAIANGRDEGVTKLLFDDSPEGRPCWPRQDPGRRHGRHACGRHDRRDRPGHRDGCRRCGHRQDHPPASDAGREHRHGGGSGAWQLHGCAACAQVSPQPSYPDKARTGDGSGLVLCVPKQSPQNTVHLYSIHVSHFKPKLYNPRHPERTLLYQTVAEHYETWLELASAGQFDGQGDHHTPKPFVRKAFAKYLECGIFAHGFARARCGDCGHDYFVAFSCKGRGVCPSCTTRRMVETAAHLNDHVSPPAGAPVGALRAQEVAVLHATRRSGAEHGAAHLSAGDRTNSADPQPRCGPYGQGRPAHRCHRLHSPIRLQPQ
jgi:hypothetical protein